MLNIRPSVGSLKSQIEALRTQILGLSDDPAALAELNARLNTMQMAADALPATQQAVAALQAAIEQAVKQDQLNGVATQADIDTIMSLVSGIHMPDTSGLATKESVDQVRSEIPSIADLATHSDVSQVAARIPDVSGLATKDAVAAVSRQIPDVSGLASKSALSTVESKIPDTSGLATKESVSLLSARIPDTSNLATSASVSAVEAKIPDISKLAGKAQVDTLTQTVAAIKVPAAASQAPPATAIKSAKGTATAFALEDHTHEETVKWCATDQKSNATGVWTATLPANRFKNAPAIFATVKAPAASFDYRATVTGTSTTGYIVTITFTQRKATLDISLSALLNVSLNAQPTIVTFDVLAAEPSTT